MNKTMFSTGPFGNLTLRRYRAGELDEESRAAIHKALAEDPELRARLAAFDAEQAAFEAAVPFERFAGGVERAARELRLQGRHPRLTSRPWFASAGLALAAAAALLLWARPDDGGRPRNAETPLGANRIKGVEHGANPEVRVANASGAAQRVALPGKVFDLQRGDRVRIGVRPGVHGHVAVISVDERKQVTALYPESGQALEILPSAQTIFLPDSVEFLGAGHEVVYVLFSEQPFAIETVLSHLQSSAGASHDMGPSERLARLHGFTTVAFPFLKP